MYSNRLVVKAEILGSQRDGSTGGFYSCLERSITVGPLFRMGDAYAVIRLHSVGHSPKSIADTNMLPQLSVD